MIVEYKTPLGTIPEITTKHPSIQLDRAYITYFGISDENLYLRVGTIYKRKLYYQEVELSKKDLNNENEILVMLLDNLRDSLKNYQP